MQEIDFSNYAKEVIKKIGSGAFLTVKNKDKINTMTIGWGSVGIIWGKPIFMVMVRKSRYTYQLIDNSDEFTVSFPDDNQLKEELSYCGSKSGRDVDKFEECSLTPVEGQKVSVPIINEAQLHFECKIRYKQDMDSQYLSDNFDEKWYPGKDYHRLFYGEVLSAYTK